MKKSQKLIFTLLLVSALFIVGCSSSNEDIAGESVKETESSEEEVIEEINPAVEAIEALNEETKDFSKKCWGAEVSSGSLIEEINWRSLTESYRGLLDDPSIDLKCSNVDHCYDYIVNLAKKINPDLSDDEFASLESSKEDTLRCEKFKPDKITKDL